MAHEWPAWVARLECCHDVGASLRRGDTRPPPSPGDELRCDRCLRMNRVVDVVTATPESLEAV
jgi:hypothetical protein